MERAAAAPAAARAREPPPLPQQQPHQGVGAGAVCELCDDGPSTHHCVECEQSMCASCCKLHAKQKTSRSHKTSELVRRVQEVAHPCLSMFLI